MIEIQIFFFSILTILSFLWKQLCIKVYIYRKTKKQKRGGKRKKEGRKKGPKQDSNRAPSARCDFT